jgi:predicted CXXCH cytochrome family protein
MISMRSLASTILILFTIIGVDGDAHASWLVDEARWHVSAHGPIMCLDCHGDVGKDAPHPDPANVDRNPGGFLRAELCGGCHDAVFTDLAAGRHGGQPLKADQDYQRCRDCHDPHYQSRITDPGKYDSSKAPTNQCGSCHEIRERLPELSPADEACMSCHRRWDPKSSEAVQHSKKLCLGCHGQDRSAAPSAQAAILPIVAMGPEGFRPHRDLSCLNCHPQAAQYGHSRQKPGDCRQCHARHDEAVIHDAHPSVSCGACHLKQVFPRKERESGLIDWVRQAASPSRLHDMTLSDDEGACRRCHHSGNAVGAAAMVLPAKSILCMPCHAATFSVSDTTTILALIVFSGGLAVSITYWFSGALPGVTAASSFVKAVWIIRETSITIFSSKIWGILRILALDGLLQRTLYRRSPSRWLTHGLMVWPLALRFLWGIVALMASLYAPGRGWPWAMLDKNHPVHGLFFDATGLMLIVGAAATMLRGASGPSAKLPSMPPHDRLASGLLGAIVLIGFVLEAMRIAMTGYPSGSAFAFVGDALSRFFWGVSGLEDIYGYVWYLHAVLTGAFVAYLPFSRMFHIVLAPVLLALNAADNNKQHQPQERVRRNRTE